MPGILGFVDLGLSKEKQMKILAGMQDSITHKDYYVKDELFSDSIIYAARSHIGVIQKETQPYFYNGLYIWLDGEFYNVERSHPKNIWNYNSDPELLASLYLNNRDFSFVKDLEGVFAAVIYDSLKRKIYLISDRTGLRHIYWTIYNGKLVWGSEVKVVLNLPDYRPFINSQSVQQFFNAGYILESNTWFEGVYLLDSASVLTWDIREHNYSIDRYWWWDQIKPLDYKLTENEIIEEIARLFKNAVAKRCDKEYRTGLTLSGGLDSRAILAAMPETQKEIHTITFGQKNCVDERFAKRASEIKGAVHHTVEINSENWLNDRFKGIWWTDGQLNIMHMHGIESIDLMRSLYSINLDGLGGGLVLGGCYLKNESFFDATIDINKASQVMYCNVDLKDGLQQYTSLKKTDYFFIQNRTRRFTYEGLLHSNTAIENKMPFHDKQLIEFVYSLPDSIRFESYIYKKMLLRTFGKYYENIPWQSIGLTIDKPRYAIKTYQCAKRIRNRAANILYRFGFPYYSFSNYCNYSEWIRQAPAKKIFEDVLLNKSAIYSDYIPMKQVADDLRGHMNGINHAEKLCLYLTFEIWLQQVFNKNYLDWSIK